MSISPEDALQNLVAKNGGLAGQSPTLGGKIIGEGIGAITIQDAIDKGKLVGSIAPGGELDGLKGIQEINNAAKINTDKSIADKTTNQGISSQSKG